MFRNVNNYEIDSNTEDLQQIQSGNQPSQAKGKVEWKSIPL